MRAAILSYPKVKIIAKNNCEHDFSLVVAREVEHALFNYILDNNLQDDKEITAWMNRVCSYDEVELNKYVKAICAEVYKELNNE